MKEEPIDRDRGRTSRPGKRCCHFRVAFSAEMQSDQIAETSLGERILAGEEAAVGIQSNLGPTVHRPCQE
jgi:hypothetical protein